MFVSQLRKDGDEYVVVVPDEELQRNGWHEGQRLALEITEVEAGAELPADLEAIVEARWERNLPALRCLADR